MQVGIIRIAQNIISDMYSCIFKNVPLYIDTGGMYYYDNNFTRNEVSIDNKMIVFLRLNGIVLTNKLNQK